MRAQQIGDKLAEFWERNLPGSDASASENGNEAQTAIPYHRDSPVQSKKRNLKLDTQLPVHQPTRRKKRSVFDAEIVKEMLVPLQLQSCVQVEGQCRVSIPVE